MNRQTFIHAAGATGLSLTSGFGFGPTDPPVAVLLNLLEDSPRELIPRELIPRELVRLIRESNAMQRAAAQLTSQIFKPRMDQPSSAVLGWKLISAFRCTSASMYCVGSTT